MNGWDEEADLAKNRYGGHSDSSSSDNDRDSCGGNKHCKRFKSNLFLVFLLIGIICGLALGLSIRYKHPEFKDNPRNTFYMNFPGKLLLRMLKMLIVPLVFFSLVSGMASLPSKAAGKLGGYAVLYYMITTFMAVLLGMLLVATIEPGLKAPVQTEQEKGSIVQPVDALLDLVRNLFPDNIVGACLYQAKTVYEKEKSFVEVNVTNSTSGLIEQINVTQYTVVDWKETTSNGTNILGIVLVAIMLGLIIGRMSGEKGRILFLVFDGMQTAIIRIIKIFIWYTPIGVCFLVAGKLISMDSMDEFKTLGWYIMTVLVGLFIHGFVILPVIYVAFTKKNPFKLVLHMGQALVTALGTASSSATMPLTLNCLEENAKVDKRVSRFMIPVGATINMDGTALYEAVASIYLAQRLGHELNAGQYVTVSLTATAAAIGAAGVPEAGLVTMLIVLTAIGLPATDETIGLILAVDWFLDRCRTMINVWGDSIGAGVVEKLSAGQLRKMDEQGITGHGGPGEGFTNQAYLTYGEKPGNNTRL